jgi:hypothetical protein
MESLGRMVRRPSLLRRFPILGRYRPQDLPLLSLGVEGQYPLLESRIAIAREILEDPFEEANQKALVCQNRHRRQRVALILGSLLSTAFGAAQAAYTSQVWIGVVVATLAAATAATSTLVQHDYAVRKYISERTKAERLRSLCFSYISAPSVLTVEPSDDKHELRQKAAAISHHGASGVR